MIPDSASKAEEPDCLAIRANMIFVAGGAGPDTPSGDCCLIDYCSRKQKHVCRSTFSAELHSLCSAVSVGILLVGFFTELINGVMSLDAMVARYEIGSFTLPLDCCVDAYSVFQNVTRAPVECPTERQLLGHALQVNHWLKQRLLRFLWWIDTRDMVVDALTEGNISRAHVTANHRCDCRISSV